MRITMNILRAIIFILFLTIIRSSAASVPLFDGKSFTGWEGDTAKTWRIENGEIVAGKPDVKQQRNEFLCTTRDYADFELRLEYRRGDNNGGIQFRSERVPNHWEVSGYQADFAPGIDGCLYDESRRNRFLAVFGVADVDLSSEAGRPGALIKRALDSQAENAKKLGIGEWNRYRIRAEGPRIRLWINDVLTVDYTEKEAGIPRTGKIAIQIHSGATEIRYRNITIEELGEKAQFLVPPDIFIHHTPERSFIGPGMLMLENGDILMAAPWGRPPTNFEQIAAKFPVPMLHRSTDGGRTWKDQGRMQMEWSQPGMSSDGGVSFLRLKDGRLAALLHRHVKDLHGGGLPTISFSRDDGATWTAARLVGEPEGVWYVMNDRLIQLRSGRLVVPVAHMPKGAGIYEGDKNLALCFFSDNGGETWKRSREPARLDDARGMQEPCVAEVEGGRLLMLARTGSGFHFSSWSDDGGDTWSKPEATTLESACSSLTLKTLPDGRLIVFYNHASPIKAGAFFPRTPLCYAVSDDGGKTWGSPVIVDDEGVANKDRQNIYPSICFTKEGMLVMWSTHGADPKGSFAGHAPSIGGGKRAILAMPAKAVPKSSPTK
jgi:hypothetical protein